MTGVFIFKNRNLLPQIDPKKLLKLSDEDIVRIVKITPKMVYFIHHRTDYDLLSDIEKIEAFQRFWDDNYSVTLKKVRGVENAYQDDKNTFYIKVLTKDAEWFKRYFN